MSSSFKISYSNCHDHLNRQVQNAECAEMPVNSQPKRAAFLNLLRSPSLPNSDSSIKQLLRSFLRVAKHWETTKFVKAAYGKKIDSFPELSSFLNSFPLLYAAQNVEKIFFLSTHHSIRINIIWEFSSALLHLCAYTQCFYHSCLVFHMQ